VTVTLVEAVVLGFLGSLVHLALAVYERKAVPGRYEIFGHVALGPVAGGLFYATGLSNHINAFFAGFFTIDFIRMLARVYKPKPAEEEGEGEG